MKRLHLIELEDLAGFPTPIRDGITDFLEYAVVVSNLYKPIIPRLERVLKTLRIQRIVDLCSGGGGPWKSLQTHLAPLREGQTTVCLTDRYPNVAALTELKQDSQGRLDFVATSISAMNVPAELEGFRTLFSSFHHFPPEQARAILEDAVVKRQGIAIFESTQRHPLFLLYMLFTPILVLLSAPFIRPFKWQRLFWTYLIPAIPLAVMFDGIVSCLRTYTVAELTELTQGLGDGAYEWEMGVERLGFLPVGVTYLIGYPKTPLTKIENDALDSR